jgi:hypothetical protein
VKFPSSSQVEKIDGGFTTQEPTPSVTEVKGILGDVNDDSVVNIADALVLHNIM